MVPRNYIGIASTGHDNALAVVDSSGRLVYAEATERPLQNKRALNCAPEDPLRMARVIAEYCEDGADLVLATTWSARAATRLQAELAAVESLLQGLAGSSLPLQEFEEYRHLLGFVLDNIHSAGRDATYAARMWGSGGRQPQTEIRRYPHHLTHAAAGCFTSPFDEAVCAVVDGFGEGASTAFYRYLDGRLQPLPAAPPLPAPGEGGMSLGLFYSALCRWCGFDPWQGEEWKVMGLAPYGKIDPLLDALMRRRIKTEDLRFRYPRAGLAAAAQLAAARRRPEDPVLDAADMACTGQAVFCDLMEALLTRLAAEGRTRNLVLAGGCALNSAWNGQVLERTPFEKLHVFSAPADDGNAAGAALLAYFEDHPDTRPGPELQTPYLGSALDPRALARLERHGALPGMRRVGGQAPHIAARLLAAGKIVAWCQGRAEFGPRALGNRSILADPRDPEMKNTINTRVKLREAYRPFAPSVLTEAGPDWFERHQDSPYMERTLRFRREWRERVPAVVHQDGTGRLQSVRQDWNPRFHALLQDFAATTGIPMVLNTSFNRMGRPIVHSVEDAVAAYLTSGIDALFLDDLLLEKSPG